MLQNSDVHAILKVMSNGATRILLPFMKISHNISTPQEYINVIRRIVGSIQETLIMMMAPIQDSACQQLHQHDKKEQAEKEGEGKKQKRKKCYWKRKT